ncbi:hypothetical protein D3C86_1672750 [compost metagenome]
MALPVWTGRTISERRSPICLGSTVTTRGGTGPLGSLPNVRWMIGIACLDVKSPETTSVALLGW